MPQIVLRAPVDFHARLCCASSPLSSPPPFSFAPSGCPLRRVLVHQNDGAATEDPVTRALTRQESIRAASSHQRPSSDVGPACWPAPASPPPAGGDEEFPQVPVNRPIILSATPRCMIRRPSPGCRDTLFWRSPPVVLPEAPPPAAFPPAAPSSAIHSFTGGCRRPLSLPVLSLRSCSRMALRQRTVTSRQARRSSIRIENAERGAAKRSMRAAG